RRARMAGADSPKPRAAPNNIGKTDSMFLVSTNDLIVSQAISTKPNASSTDTTSVRAKEAVKDMQDQIKTEQQREERSSH
ncbi:MAG: hypothetical protein ACXWQQ_17115, partial [Pseudobdellovibrio sp.]